MRHAPAGVTTAYQLVLVFKFLSVMGFAGGAIAALLADDAAARKRAVHRVASPCLFATWLCGYTLLELNGWPWSELWVMASLLLSVLANGVLSLCAARGWRGPRAVWGVALPIIGVVVLMVSKPTWARVLP
jgi:hypothetical protein